MFKKNIQIFIETGYKYIQDLKIGDMVQTFEHGFKKIDIIRTRQFIHTVINEQYMVFMQMDY